MVVAEATYFVGTRMGPQAEAAFLRGIASLEIETPEPQEWLRIAELVEKYADLPLGAADASVVTLAERLGAETIVTLDRRHFSVVRPAHVDAFELLPAA
jgi:predicted nucleic acid-binding protein